MIRFAAALLAASFAGVASAQPTAIELRRPALPIEIRMDALPVEGVRTAPGFRATGAWRLSATHPGFGGFSGLTEAANEMWLLSDRGWLVQWRPDTSSARIMALPDKCRAGIGKHALDGEAIAQAPDGSGFAVALERPSRLCTFDPKTPENASVVLLDAKASGNRGVEAMATLASPGMVLIAEREAGGTHDLSILPLGRPVPQATRLAYRAPTGFKPADAAYLPDGRMLILNRRFQLSGRSTVITALPPFGEWTDGVVSGAEIARIENSPLAANYEGISVEITPPGAAIWLISDDNFDDLKGTLLLRLEFDSEAANSAKAAGTTDPVQ